MSLFPLLALACQPQQGPADLVDPGDDPTPVAVPADAQQTIGPEGGTLTLDNGVTLTLPAGFVEEETLFEVSVSDAVASGYEEDGYVSHLAAFSVSPALVSATGEPAVLALPEREDPVALVLLAEGIAEGIGRTETGILWAPEEEGGSTFADPFLAEALYQPVVWRPEELSGPAGPPPPNAPSWTDAVVNRGCYAVLRAVGFDDPLEVERVVRLSTPFATRAQTNFNEIGDADRQEAFVDAVNRFQAKACLAAYRAGRYLEEQRGYHLRLGFDGLTTTRRVPVAIAWSGTRPDGSCGSQLAEADGRGITMFFDPGGCIDVGYSGYDAAADWNTDDGWDPDDLEDHDAVDRTMAHELGHYAQDLANLRIDGIVGLDSDAWSKDADGDGALDGDFWVEGGAEAIAEEAYDKVGGGSFGPAKIWEQDLRTIPYSTHAFWRWADWYQDDPQATNGSTARVLARIRSQAQACYPTCTVRPTSGDVEAVLGEMRSDHDGDSLALSITHFAGDYLAFRAFEYGSTGTEADRFDDVVGWREAEAHSGGLWEDWVVSGTTIPHDHPEVEPITPAGGLQIEGDTTVHIDPGKVAYLYLDFTSPLWPVYDERTPLVSLSSDGAGVSAVVFSTEQKRTPDNDRHEAHRVWSRESLTTDGAKPDQLGVPFAIASRHKPLLALFNPGSTTREVKLETQVPEPRLAVAGRVPGTADGAVAFFTGDGDPAVPDAVGDPASFLYGVDAGTRYLAREVWENRLWVSLETGALQAVDLRRGAEQDLHLLSIGDETRGLAVHPWRRRLVVAELEALVLVDTEDNKVLREVWVGDLGLSTNERPYDVVIGDDGEVAWVSVYNRYGGAGRSVLAVDLARLEAGQAPVIAQVDLGAETNPRNLALSHDGKYLAAACGGLDVVCVVDTRVGHLAGYLVEDAYYQRQGWRSSGIEDVAWSGDDKHVFASYREGHNDLADYGVVRRCDVDEYGECRHEVAVDGEARSIVVQGEPGFQTVYVADSLGHLTRLKEEWFESSELTTGHDSYSGQVDGTGGCVEQWQYGVAVSCTDWRQSDPETTYLNGEILAF